MRPPIFQKAFYFLIFTFVLGFLLFNLTLDISHHQSTNAPQHVTKKVVDCKGCKEVLAKAAKYYAEPWKLQDDNHQEFTFRLSSKCNGSEEAIITQANTPLNSVISFSGESRSKADVTPALFDGFPKEHIFSSKKLDTCSVVGNGGILINSTCGKQIDSAQFVFRCNLPPVDKRFKMHVGNKTDLVTANPSIFYIKFAALNKNKTPQFLETMQAYGSSYLWLPAFSLRYNTKISIRAARVIKEFKSPIKPVFANPKYHKKLHSFWSSLGLREARLSTGFMIVSLALEVCKRVDLYGFWPFEIHPERFNLLTNHYYDNVPAKKAFHAMPSEFERLLQLHSKGVLRIHLGDCQPDF
ncbi:alpha-2,8-sialyltransferase 8F-like isoform X2 [Gouania willdenowi]|uniref:alpha-2,8-sialyltransferase 8F-like isoform X2 n=1 Tax=Gouania willdenowi TaxID=441366 RepID=UPI00105472B3|nr:alpha-2,8-sialyltransferase 8F-like isoform X2 [Gouania willdenowi]